MQVKDFEKKAEGEEAAGTRTGRPTAPRRATGGPGNPSAVRTLTDMPSHRSRRRAKTQNHRYARQAALDRQMYRIASPGRSRVACRNGAATTRTASTSVPKSARTRFPTV